MSPGLLVAIPVVLFLGYGILQTVKFGGLKAAGFRARINGKVGEMPLAIGSLTSTRLSVYRLDGGSDRAVGVMISSGMATRMQVPLSTAQTQRLMEMLEAEASGG